MSDTVTELRARDPLLFWTGALMTLALVVVTLLSIGDQRLILGINPWIKPMKFLVSITIFLWTTAWFMPETEPDLVKRALVRWTISVAMVLFLWILRRDSPTNRAGYLWGVRWGVALFVLASWQGFTMVANNGHAVPGPDGGLGLPFVNWSIEMGDLRSVHFFGMHAMQALPLLGFLLDRTIGGDQPNPLVPTARNVVMASGIAWFVVMGLLLTIALLGRPLMAL